MIKQINFTGNIEDVGGATFSLFFKKSQLRFFTKNCKSTVNGFCKFYLVLHKMIKYHSVNIISDFQLDILKSAAKNETG